LEYSSLGKDNQQKIFVCERVLQWNFPLSSEKLILSIFYSMNPVQKELKLFQQGGGHAAHKCGGGGRFLEVTSSGRKVHYNTRLWIRLHSTKGTVERGTSMRAS
jgi:hypothetical protein